MEYDCHIFLKYLVFQMKNLVFQSNTLDFARNIQISISISMLVPNVWTVTKRRSAGLKKITINSNSNYDVVIL